jgi:hypothetical protein
VTEPAIGAQQEIVSGASPDGESAGQAPAKEIEPAGAESAA